MHFCVEDNSAWCISNASLHRVLHVQGVAVYPPGEAGQGPAPPHSALQLQPRVLHHLEPGVPGVADEAGAHGDHRHGGQQGHGQGAAVEGCLAVKIVHPTSARQGWGKSTFQWKPIRIFVSL